MGPCTADAGLRLRGRRCRMRPHKRHRWAHDWAHWWRSPCWWRIVHLLDTCLCPRPVPPSVKALELLLLATHCSHHGAQPRRPNAPPSLDPASRCKDPCQRRLLRCLLSCQACSGEDRLSRFAFRLGPHVLTHLPRVAACAAPTHDGLRPQDRTSKPREVLPRPVATEQRSDDTRSDADPRGLEPRQSRLSQEDLGQTDGCIVGEDAGC